MSEVRAPDPTLDAMLTEDVEHRVLVSEDTSVRGGMVAHRPFGSLPERTAVDRAPRTACGLIRSGEGFRVAQARHVRWHAVPCRECFPDAPPPGTDPLNRPNAGRYLRWQTIT